MIVRSVDSIPGAGGGVVFNVGYLVSLLSHTYTTSLRSALTSASRGRPNTGFVERCRYVLQEEAAAAPAPGVQHKERARWEDQNGRIDKLFMFAC